MNDSTLRSDKQNGVDQSNASWGSPAESLFSDFSYPLDGPTPPPSPSLHKTSLEYEGKQSMEMTSPKTQAISPEPRVCV